MMKLNIFYNTTIALLILSTVGFTTPMAEASQESEQEDLSPSDPIYCFIQNQGFDRELEATEISRIENEVSDGKDPDNYLQRDCPVVGNKKTKIYHVPGQLNYNQMLIVNKEALKNPNKDNRICFDTEGDAKDSGYKKSRSANLSIPVERKKERDAIASKKRDLVSRTQDCFE